METNIGFGYLLKCVGYVVTINVLSVVIMLLYANRVVTDITSLLCQIVMLIVSFPFYFVVKDEAEKPMLYTIATVILHAVLSIAVWFGLCVVYDGWERVMFYYAEMFLAVFFASIFLLDTVLYVINKHFK